MSRPGLALVKSSRTIMVPPFSRSSLAESLARMRPGLGASLSGAGNRLERFFRRGEQRFRSHGSAGRLLHPEIRRDVADARHPLELRSDPARLLHLLFDLESD